MRLCAESNQRVSFHVCGTLFYGIKILILVIFYGMLLVGAVLNVDRLFDFLPIRTFFQIQAMSRKKSGSN